MLHATWDLKYHFQLRVLPATLRHLPLMTLVSPLDLAIFLEMVGHGHWCCPHYGSQLRFSRLSLAAVLKSGTPKAAGSRCETKSLDCLRLSQPFQQGIHVSVSFCYVKKGRNEVTSTRSSGLEQIVAAAKPISCWPLWISSVPSSRFGWLNFSL